VSQNGRAKLSCYCRVLKNQKIKDWLSRLGISVYFSGVDLFLNLKNEQALNST
jgi:hypothetical protein